MALYEIKRNALNTISLDPAEAGQILFGPNAVVAEIVRAILKRRKQTNRGTVVALDGWYGVPWQEIIDAIALRTKTSDVEFRFVSVASAFKSPEELAAAKRKYLTDDPGFGWVNSDGTLEELLDPAQTARIRQEILEAKNRTDRPAVLVLFGCGASPPEWETLIDMTLYFDKTRQPLLWEMWDGKLAPFGSTEPRPEYHWKEYYYCDFYLLDRQKERLLPKMDYWIEAIAFESLKMLPGKVYDNVVAQLVRQPIKEVNIIQPGPWGAYRYKDWVDVPGLECNAWHELAGPELSVLVDVGRGEPVNFPFTNLMQHAELLVGPRIAEDFPGLFPLDVWLDDGYFPEPTPAERISMPIHNHPSTDYVRKNFNEPLGRYETYYIAEAYVGANTWHGFNEGVDLEEWERLCRESNNLVPIENWSNYIANWQTNVGDLFLIPPGTTHGHGGNQMVLEMDTCPSIAGTEYSFFMYDFARNSWDESKKSMTGPPCKMHLERGFQHDKWVQSDYSRRFLQPKPRVVRWTREFQMDRYDSEPRMPFEIERFHFEQRAENDTRGRFTNILTLTVGRSVTIRSLAHPEKSVNILKFQSAVVPACFGAYEIVNDGECFCTVVQLRWKT